MSKLFAPSTNLGAALLTIQDLQEGIVQLHCHRKGLNARYGFDDNPLLILPEDELLSTLKTYHFVFSKHPILEATLKSPRVAPYGFEISSIDCVAEFKAPSREICVNVSCNVQNVGHVKALPFQISVTDDDYAQLTTPGCNIPEYAMEVIRRTIIGTDPDLAQISDAYKCLYDYHVKFGTSDVLINDMQM